MFLEKVHIKKIKCAYTSKVWVVKLFEMVENIYTISDPDSIGSKGDEISRL